MKRKNIKHIFFDLDHTLWDFDINSELAFSAIFKKNAIEIDLKNFLKEYAPINLKYWELYRNDQISKEDLRFQRLKECFDCLEIEVDSELINVLAVDYIEHLPFNNHLLDGAKEILDYLFSYYELHIITNGFEEVQNKKIVNAGIDHFFKTITTSEKAGVKKPNPKIFEYALIHSGANAENSIMIGDNMEADIIGAQNFGLQAIHFNYYREKVKTADFPFPSVQRLSDLSVYL